MPKVTLRRLPLVLLLFLAGYIFWIWDGSAPEVSWDALRPAYGKHAKIDLVISDQGGGLKAVRVEVHQAGQVKELFSEEYRALGWFDRAGTNQRSLGVSLEDAELAQGDFELVVWATDQPILGLWSRSAEASKKLVFDARPPILTVLGSTHVIRQGGSELVVFESSEDLSRAGVQAGERFFPGFLQDPEKRQFAVMFALAHDGEINLPFNLIGTDGAGNETRVRLAVEVIPGKFRNRRINISDSFIEKVASDILPRTSDVAASTTLVETFVKINRDLRRINHKFIQKLSERTAPAPLWTEPFAQLSRSQAEANFADHRTYYYGDKIVDRQTHQGFDLASVVRSAVEAANAGRVLFAGYLGIYGNCVILDHGLGLLSLYGHLSSLEVSEGDRVHPGQSLGRTGETGLAGGDHLHFSTIVSGVQVSPLEWWDPSWVRIHIRNRLVPPD